MILLDRASYEQQETELLAPYAMKSALSKGRKYPEPLHSYRPIFQRDRDRIVHSRAFRRLEYKTQVFVNHEGDHYRTRLTHTLEVAMIGRSIARTLRLNEDLAEAMAFIHDIGHPPFGHSGEQALNALMEHHGGFEHNLQALRLVEKLEKKYPEFDGLNLSWEVREGILKKNIDYNKPGDHQYEPEKAPLLEVQVVDVADEIAYNSHDLDDGLRSGLLAIEDLQQVDIWAEVEQQIRKQYPALDGRLLGYYVVRGIIDMQVRDVLNQTQANLQAYGINSVNDVQKTFVPLVSLSPIVAEKHKQLKRFLYTGLYTHHQVEIMNQKGLRIITELFNLFIDNPRLLEPYAYVRLEDYPLHRVVCDYIAGMTDRYAFNEYAKLCSLTEKNYF
ncbi:MAG: deoxyguanosinetriphosphate triphosphohydrolase [bacterium]|nr:deoxyguanosinetriphosphate triphosphohydrolase [bacterium]